MRRIEVHEGDHHLAAVPGVDQTRCIDAGDAVLSGQTASRQHESRVPLGDRDGEAGRHHGATAAGRDRARFHGDQIASRIANVRERRQRGVGVQDPNGDFHRARLYKSGQR